MKTEVAEQEKRKGRAEALTPGPSAFFRLEIVSQFALCIIFVLLDELAKTEDSRKTGKTRASRAEMNEISCRSSFLLLFLPRAEAHTKARASARPAIVSDLLLRVSLFIVVPFISASCILSAAPRHCGSADQSFDGEVLARNA